MNFTGPPEFHRRALGAEPSFVSAYFTSLPDSSANNFRSSARRRLSTSSGLVGTDCRIGACSRWLFASIRLGTSRLHCAIVSVLLNAICQSPIKLDKCRSSLRRHNAVSAALEALGSAIVHPVGQPINHYTKAGFKRRGEVGSLSDDFGPAWACWTGGEKWCST